MFWCRGRVIHCGLSTAGGPHRKSGLVKAFSSSHMQHICAYAPRPARGFVRPYVRSPGSYVRMYAHWYCTLEKGRRRGQQVRSRLLRLLIPVRHDLVMEDRLIPLGSGQASSSSAFAAAVSGRVFSILQSACRASAVFFSIGALLLRANW